MRESIVICGDCELRGESYKKTNLKRDDQSPKSYGVTIILIWAFGLLGLHHFYLRNWLHGLFDFGLFVFGFSFLFLSNNPSINSIGLVLIIIDIIHSFYITYLVIVGRCRDGNGLLLAYPGQKQ